MGAGSSLLGSLGLGNLLAGAGAPAVLDLVDMDGGGVGRGGVVELCEGVVGLHLEGLLHVLVEEADLDRGEVTGKTPSSCFPSQLFKTYGEHA